MQFPSQAVLSKAEIEESEVFAPRFDAAGLVTVVAIEAGSNLPLMLAHMSAEALSLTLQTGEMHYFSRSRNRIWKKGETSGEVQKLVEMRIDCDQDALIAYVTPTGHGAACHTGRKSCFYRKLVALPGGAHLQKTGETRLFDPGEVYGDRR
ncbi:MAG: phosphoribosyl-AMP cyclohydrolase [Alphaproteobacteria bacterium]|nr:phosphoribosyl-AMP cyclohydrolase [Alphaproteobacteria bacterium]